MTMVYVIYIDTYNRIAFKQKIYFQENKINLLLQ